MHSSRRHIYSINSIVEVFLEGLLKSAMPFLDLSQLSEQTKVLLLFIMVDDGVVRAKTNLMLGSR